MSETSFSAATFWSKVDDVEDMIGELWGIDQALSAWDSRTPAEGFDVFDEGTHIVAIELGRTYPFTEKVYCASAVVSPFGDILSGDPTGWARGLVDEGRSMAKAELAPWRAQLEALVNGRSGEFVGAADALNASINFPLKGAVVDDFAGLDKSLGDWEGSSADQFGTYFVNKVQAATQLQQFAAEGVRTIIAAGKATVDSAQTALMQLVEGTWQALDEQLKARNAAHAPQGSSTVDWLLGAVAVLAVVAAVPTGGASIGALEAGVALAGAGSALLEYGATQVDEPQEQTIELTYASDALDGVTGGFRDIVRVWDDNWRDIDEKLAAPISHWIDSAIDDGLMWPERPWLLDGVRPGDFHHESVHY